MSMNEATVCNTCTWFMKRDINKHTWQHPKSKKWHCIDYAAVHQRDRRFCLDAAVMKGAECHIDHQMLRIKQRAHQANPVHKQLQKGRKYNVGLLCEGKLRDRDSNEVMNGRVCGALVQFGCYQHRYEWKGLWCSSRVWLLSTQHN